MLWGLGQPSTVEASQFHDSNGFKIMTTLPIGADKSLSQMMALHAMK
jgi:hypothetical protein